MISSLRWSLAGDGRIGKSTVRDHDVLVVDGQQGCITDLDLGYRSLTSILSVDDDVVSHLERLEQKKHHSSGQVGKSALQGKTQSNTGSSKKCCQG